MTLPNQTQSVTNGEREREFTFAKTFLQRAAMLALQRAVLATAIPSVRLSVTRRKLYQNDCT